MLTILQQKWGSFGPGPTADQGQGDVFLGPADNFVERFDSPVLGQVAAGPIESSKADGGVADRRHRGSGRLLQDFPSLPTRN